MDLNCVPSRSTTIQLVSIVESHITQGVEANNAGIGISSKRIIDDVVIRRIFINAAAANVTRDLNFNGTISGNVYAQPLYVENGPGGAAMVIVVTESNNIYALNAATGSVIWQRNVGPPVSSGLPCGNISPLGITGTPVVDLASRALFFDAMSMVLQRSISFIP